jgi:cytochrome c
MVRLLTRLFLAAIVTVAGLAPTIAAAADVLSSGKAVFASQCSICHSNARNGPVILGPPLYGVIGRKAGSVGGFAYSSAMKSAGFVWTPDRLRAYLPGPRDYLPGVKMTYAGLKNPSQLDALITYLDSLK